MRMLIAPALLLSFAACASAVLETAPASALTAAQMELPDCPELIRAGMGRPASEDWRHYVTGGIVFCVPANWKGGPGGWAGETASFAFAESGELAIYPVRYGDQRQGLLRTAVSGMPAEFWYIDARSRYRNDSTVAVAQRRPIPPVSTGYSTFASWPAIGIYMGGRASNEKGILANRAVFLSVRFVPTSGPGRP